MSWLDWLAWFVLGVQTPIPLFWLVVHPFVGFWKTRPRLVYGLVAPGCWLAVNALLLAYRDGLFASALAPPWGVALGLALIGGDAWFLLRVHHDLGGPRLLGRAELAGGRELVERGLYAYVRHPRYTGMMAAVLGACLVAGTLRLWAVALGWWGLALLAVWFEERELHARFGRAWESYARRVPRFLPFRLGPPGG